MKEHRTHRLRSTIPLALKALALVSVARTIGPKRIGRVAALATEGYFAHRRDGRRS
jgi:hypothetical protein